MTEFSTDIGEWQCVKSYLNNFPKQGKGADLHKRFDRLMAVRDVQVNKQINSARTSINAIPEIDKAWRKIVKFAKSEDAILSVFLGLPDKATSQPFTGLSNGKRATSPAAQREKYLEMAAHAKALIAYLASNKSGDPFKQLLADLDNELGWEARTPKSLDTDMAQIMQEHVKDADAIWQANHGLNVRLTLKFLFHAFSGANSHKYYLTKQPESKEAAAQTYVHLLAELNCYLSKPQHAAIATIAIANVPELEISSDAIRQAWASVPQS
jgi:hypothetical protein